MAAARTLSSLILRTLGRVPRAGESVKIGDFDAIVERVRGATIEQVRLRRWMIWLVAALAGCIMLQALSAASEIALVSADEAKIRPEREWRPLARARQGFAESRSVARAGADHQQSRDRDRGRLLTSFLHGIRPRYGYGRHSSSRR